MSSSRQAYLEEQLSFLSSNGSLNDSSSINPIIVLSTNNADNAVPTSATVRTAEQLEDHLRAISTIGFTARFYAIYQPNSLASLNLDTPMLRSIGTRHCLMPAFFEILGEFRFKEGGSRIIYEPPFRSQPSDELIEYTYTLNYAERRDEQSRGTYQRWTIRKLALYHSYDLGKRHSVFILLSPNRQSRAEADVIEWLTRARDRFDGYEDHFALHELILSYHVNNWNPYMDYYGTRLDKLLSDLRHQQAGEDVGAVPGTLQFLEELLSPIELALSSTRQLIRDIRHLVDRHETYLFSQPTRRDHVKRFYDATSTQVDFIERRLNDLLKRRTSAVLLLAELTASKDRQVLRKQNERVVDSTESTSKDSTATRIATMIASLLLPANLVATIMSMPFFRIDASDHLHASSQFWVYASAVVPLTAMMLLYSKWDLQRRDRRRYGASEEAL